MKTTTTAILGAVAMVVMTGCAEEPIVGTWRATDDVEGERATLDLSEGDGSGTGSATIYGWVSDDAGYWYFVEAENDVRWTLLGEGLYSLDLTCRSAWFPDYGEGTEECDGLDIELECNLVGDEERRLECEGPNDFEITFERQGE